MNHHATLMLLITLGTLLWLSRLLGELARKIGLPSVVGEMSAGLLLSSSLLGGLIPIDISNPFFSGFETLASILLLFLAGLEIPFDSFKKHLSSSVWMSAWGITFPFLLGGVLTYQYPESFGFDHSTDLMTFALFIGTALSITALPVIIKMLIDQNLHHTRFGIIIISTAILNDIVGWAIFSAVLSGSFSPKTILISLSYMGIMLTLGTECFNRLLPWLMKWSQKILSYCLGVALFAAAFTEWLGIHPLFGAFAAGMSMGNVKQFHDETRKTVFQFVNSFFAPVFFALLGLKINLISDFNPSIVAVIFVIACAGKIAGCGLGAKLLGMSWKQSLTMGLTLNARGAMEIILGGVALEYGIIGKPVYVALVVTAVATSIIAGFVVSKPVRRLS